MHPTSGWCTTDSWSSKTVLQREGMFCCWNLRLERIWRNEADYCKCWQPAAYQTLWCHNQEMAVVITVCYCSSIVQQPALGPSLISSLPPDIPTPSLSPPSSYIQQQWGSPHLMSFHPVLFQYSRIDLIQGFSWIFSTILFLQMLAPHPTFLLFLDLGPTSNQHLGGVSMCY